MISKVVKIVPGGVSGLDSIYNALQAAREHNTPDSIVLIHDGVRPCITKELIDEDLMCVRKNGTAITCTPLYETPVICCDGQNIDEIPPRANFYTAQAPQCFRLGDVLEAHALMRKDNPKYEGGGPEPPQEIGQTQPARLLQGAVHPLGKLLGPGTVPPEDGEVQSMLP